MKVLDSSQFVSERMKIRPVTNIELNQIQQDIKDMKYELTDETTKTIDGVTLYRIKALKDIPSKGVKKGDLGGWVESYDNLDQMGDCWVADEALVRDNAQVYGNAFVSEKAFICDNAKIYGNARVKGNAEVYGRAEVYGNAQVYGDAKVCGNAKVVFNTNKGTIDK